MKSPIALFQASLHRKLSPQELKWVEDWKAAYPYWEVFHYMIAKQSEKERDLFLAATYASERGMLQGYMEGLLSLPKEIWEQVPNSQDDAAPSVGKEFPEEESLATPEKLASSEDHVEENSALAPSAIDLKEPSSPYNDVFSVLDFDQLHQREANPQELLMRTDWLKPESHNEFLNLSVKTTTLKYLRLLRKIRSQVRAYALRSSEAAEQDHEVSQPPPLAQQPVHQALTAPGLPRESKPEQPDLMKVIEKIIENKPSHASMPEVVEPDSLALASVEQDQEMVTETLAKLHVIQGNKPEAIRIYHKLRLRFPEKSAYFAQKIVELEEN